MKKITDCIKKYPLLVAFAVFMLSVFVADMFATGKQFSEMENRELKQRPTFSWRSLAANEYTRKYEEFINDQFVERDRWISLKSVGESVFCKIENNGVAYGDEGYMFGVKTTVEESQLQKNIGYLNTFLSGYTGHVTLGIIPNSYEMMPDYLPAGLEYIKVDQSSRIEHIYSEVQGDRLETLDLFEPLAALPEGEAYYRTDHHWTTEGAYSAYAAYCRQRGLRAVELGSLAELRRETPDYYGTYYSKAKKLDTTADTLIWYDVPVDSVTIDGKNYITDAKNQRIPVEGMYQKSKLDTRDKYAMFLYGNNGLTVIKSQNNLNHVEGKTSRVMVIKDSYANCMVPFLTYSYDEVYVVDLRGLGEKLTELVKRVEFDDLWVLYNYESFEDDRNFARMTF